MWLKMCKICQCYARRLRRAGERFLVHRAWTHAEAPTELSQRQHIETARIKLYNKTEKYCNS